MTNEKAKSQVVQLSDPQWHANNPNEKIQLKTHFTHDPLCQFFCVCYASMWGDMIDSNPVLLLLYPAQNTHTFFCDVLNCRREKKRRKNKMY